MELVPPKRPDTDFFVRLVGRGVRPWTVGARSLARVLDAVQRLVDQTEPIEEGDKTTIPTPKVAIRVLGVVSKSAGYAVSSSNAPLALRLIAATGKAIEKPEQAEWTPPTLSALEDLSEVARAHGCEIEILKPGKGSAHGDVLARIKPATFSDISSSAFVIGNTSVFARVERAGGAHAMHCGIRVPGQPRMVVCRVVSEDLVRELGQFIYQDLVLHGEATWYRQNLFLRRLVISNIEQPKTGSFVQSMREIAEAGGSAWAKVQNPDQFLIETRGS